MLFLECSSGVSVTLDEQREGWDPLLLPPRPPLPGPSFPPRAEFETPVPLPTLLDPEPPFPRLPTAEPLAGVSILLILAQRGKQSAPGEGMKKICVKHQTCKSSCKTYSRYHIAPKTKLVLPRKVFEIQGVTFSKSVMRQKYYFESNYENQHIQIMVTWMQAVSNHYNIRYYLRACYNRDLEEVGM